MTLGPLLLATDVGPSDLGPVAAVAAVAAVAGTTSVLLGRRGLLLPAVVLELLLGVAIGPEVAGLEVTKLLVFMQAAGLALLFFFAGYEIDPDRIGGSPLRLALIGWGFSLLLAYSIGGALAAAGIVLSLLYTGSALATTAIGTLIPILSDSGQLKTRMGTNLLAAGAVGEFGPIILLTVLLAGGQPLTEAAILVGFIAAAVAVALLAVRSRRRSLPLFESTVETSSQIAVRWLFLLVMALVLLASDLGIDLLLGGFAAGMITRRLIGKREVPVLESKLTAIAFGVFIPYFFVVSGMRLDFSALMDSPSGLLLIPLFFVLFLVVRGVPALVVYRKVLDRSERLALAFFSSTQLPLVLAITTVALEAGHMRKRTAAALVAAAVLSTVIFPLLGMRISERHSRKSGSPQPAT